MTMRGGNGAEEVDVIASLTAAIGDRLMGDKPLTMAYGQSVIAEVTNYIEKLKLELQAMAKLYEPHSDCKESGFSCDFRSDSRLTRCVCQIARAHDYKI